MAKGKLRKPRALYLRGRRCGSIDVHGVMYVTYMAHLNSKATRRLHAWLGKAIAWGEAVQGD